MPESVRSRCSTTLHARDVIASTSYAVSGRAAPEVHLAGIREALLREPPPGVIFTP